ncbi:unnamed protein product [Sphagnum troendelagicum]|uniref:Uncharacterized protein n=1 Tax=Sphagnum troendelagicum TaxID=128251 RepID=A0ABP0U5W9_9BRYO
MEKVFSMVGSDGEFSYHQMGVIQAYTIRKLEPLLVEAIKHLSLPEHGPLHIADFGCSTEKNSITCINFIVKSIAERYAKAAGETSGHDTTCMPKMLVFFVDLPLNDFNHLIQLLASNKAKNGGDSTGVDGADVEKVNNYFSATMGGSFYNRSLPKESMHFAISTICNRVITKVCDPKTNSCTCCNSPNPSLSFTLHGRGRWWGQSWRHTWAYKPPMNVLFATNDALQLTPLPSFPTPKLKKNTSASTLVFLLVVLKRKVPKSMVPSPF